VKKSLSSYKKKFETEISFAMPYFIKNYDFTPNTYKSYCTVIHTKDTKDRPRISLYRNCN